MKNRFYIGTFIFGMIVCISAINVPNTIQLEYPENWPIPTYEFSRNPLTEEGVELGRALFYDPILSLDSTISCANCHLSYTAFTHVDHALSHGIQDRIGTRNSMTLMNLAWSKFFMWDGAVNHLDMQALAPISHPKEMGEELNKVLEKLNNSSGYLKQFQEVFGQDEITGELLLKSLAQFQLTLISANTKYDKVIRNEPGVTFSNQEQRGYSLFQTHCNACHEEPLFTSGAFANNGLSLDERLNDMGRMKITGLKKDSLQFKIPTLRNIEFSRPYMHDGRFDKLGEVLKHYTQGISPSQTLAIELKNGLELTEHEQVDIIAFLLTLSDKDFLFNPKHAFPRNN